jgi:hypothetical protein
VQINHKYFYIVEPKFLAVYQEIMNRLYSERSWKLNEMRDLANRMDATATMHKPIPVTIKDGQIVEVKE